MQFIGHIHLIVSRFSRLQGMDGGRELGVFCNPLVKLVVERIIGRDQASVDVSVLVERVTCERERWVLNFHVYRVFTAEGRRIRLVVGATLPLCPSSETIYRYSNTVFVTYLGFSMYYQFLLLSLLPSQSRECKKSRGPVLDSAVE